MILYPAIDLKDGAAVRLLRGDMNATTVFNEDPADQARSFCEQGFSHLHIIDLDGAFAGEPGNYVGEGVTEYKGKHKTSFYARASITKLKGDAWRQ